ncbi:MAG: prolyl oligopeptidase family serine peptidase [Actinomycetes bacterium]
MSDEMPIWEQRVRASQLLSFSLSGAPVVWAADVSDRGVLLANVTGRTEVFAFDAATSPATLRQVTDRPQGTTGTSIAPDGSAVFWFDDHAGDEVGRWQRDSLDGGPVVTMLPNLAPSYSGGFQPLSSGGAVVARLVEEGFELAVAASDGTGDVVYRSKDQADLEDVTPDEGLALLAFAPGGDWLHLGVRVVSLVTGAVVAELAEPGRNLHPVGFDPQDPSKVLVVHEPQDRATPMIWNTGSGDRSDMVTGLEGDVFADWYPDGSALLLTVLHEARHRLFRFERESAQLSAIAAPDGAVAVASARPDGSVHVLTSRSDRPVELVAVTEEGARPLVRLPGEPPPETVAASDVYADGPAGRVHGLLYRPRRGVEPFATVFMVHGGPTGQDVDGWNDIVAAVVDHGYAVVRVNYRGSTGYGAQWRDALHERLGFIELEDISAVRTQLESDGVVDPDRVSVAGGSWGGFLTLMALGTQPTQWRSGAALVPLADWFTSSQDAPSFMQAYDASLMGGTIEQIPDVYRAASPITYADAVQAPVFVTAGENDPRCPVRQVDTYVEALRARDHDVRYERLATGHAMPDLDLKVAELRTMLNFLTETNPA